MKRTLKRRSLLWLVLASGAAVAALAVAQFGFFTKAEASPRSHSPKQPHCSLATLHGMYVANQNGSQVTGNTPGPFATAAIYVFDGHGHAQGTTTRSVNGNITSHLDFSDVYTLNADCIGTETVTDTTGAVRHYDLYTVPSGSRFTFIRTDPGIVVSGVAVANRD